MGILTQRWEADHAGHKLVVTRNEITKGFNLECDGVELARRTWSWIGLGELHATADFGGRPVELRVAIEWGGLGALTGRCSIRADGKELAVRTE